jgi:hypothetical protein
MLHFSVAVATSVLLNAVFSWVSKVDGHIPDPSSSRSLASRMKKPYSVVLPRAICVTRCYSRRRRRTLRKESGAEEKGKDSAPFSLFHPNRS